MEARPKRQRVARDRTPKTNNRDYISYVVIGGGVAGVCCAQELSRHVDNVNQRIMLISATDTLIETSSIMRMTEHLEELKVFEQTAEKLQTSMPNVEIVINTVVHIDTKERRISLKDDTKIYYQKLCICSGVSAKSFIHPLQHENIICLRDAVSIDKLKRKLRGARKILVLGNGGIAMEVVHELRDFDIAWVVREDYVGSVFFDKSSALFIDELLRSRQTENKAWHERTRNETSSNSQSRVDSDAKRVDTIINSNSGIVLSGDRSGFCSSDNDNNNDNNYNDSDGNNNNCREIAGAALGPAWAQKTDFHGENTSDSLTGRGRLEIFYEDEAIAFSDDHCRTWLSVNSNNNNNSNNNTISVDPSALDLSEVNFQYKIYIATAQQKVIGADFIISATGVVANTQFLDVEVEDPLLLDEENFLIVNNQMRTSDRHVFAAGDCCKFLATQEKISRDLISRELISSQREKGERLRLPSTKFFQQRLWSQARTMGVVSALAMAGRSEEFAADQSFALFAHVTRFFGFKVVLLGLYNAQGIQYHDAELQKKIKTIVVNEAQLTSDTNEREELEVWIRCTPRSEYIKFVVCRGKLVGALMIGDSELEEVAENLILNELDIQAMNISLLNPDLDLADYFD